MENNNVTPLLNRQNDGVLFPGLRKMTLFLQTSLKLWQNYLKTFQRWHSWAISPHFVEQFAASNEAAPK